MNNGKGDKTRPSNISNSKFDKNWEKTFSKTKSKKSKAKRKKHMSRALLSPKNKDHSIALGIENGLWFLQVFDLEYEREHSEEKLLVDIDTSNRWKIVELIDSYADTATHGTRSARESVILDLDPGTADYRND
jgi:hypothetical protein